MKRALAIFAVLSLFGFAGLAQFFGSWDVTLNILPALGLDESTLVLNYEAAGWTFTSTSTFDPGFSEIEFGASGAFGAFTIEASAVFSPDDDYLKWITNTYTTPVIYPVPPATPSATIHYNFGYVVDGPAYRSSELSASMDFAGVNFGLDITHESPYMVQLSWAEYGSQLACPLPKYFVTMEDIEYDVPVVVAFLDDMGTQTTSDDVLMYMDRFTLEMDTPGTLSADATQFLAAILADLQRFATGTVYMLTPTYDPDDITVSILLPSYMTYTFTAELDPFSAEIMFDDVCTGIQFREATLSMSDVSLCCGISYDAELAFNKCDGFDHLTFSIDNLFPLCCGISFDLEVEFGVDYKTVTLEPSIEIGAECLDLGIELGWDQPTLDSLSISYIGITCEYGDCLTGLFGTAFPTSTVAYLSAGTYYVWMDSDGNPHIADYVVFPFVFSFTLAADAPGREATSPSDWGLETGETDLMWVVDQQQLIIGWGQVQWLEYEVAKLSFCGPACCGGQYTVDVAAYWAEYWQFTWLVTDPTVINVTQIYPTLFGLSRVAIDVTLPLIGDTLDATVSYEYNLYTGDTTLDVGWSFSF